MFSPDRQKLLMCRRLHAPYKGLLNFVGGKIAPGETGLEAAYRELWEETGVTVDDIHLAHLMDMTYYLDGCYVEVYVGRLHKQVAVHGDENALHWLDRNYNFFDSRVFAGEGNIGHVLEHVDYWGDRVLL